MGTSDTSQTPELHAGGASAAHPVAAQEIAALKALNTGLAARIKILEEQLRLATVKTFAPTSEKLASLGHPDLFFNEADTVDMNI